MPSKQPAPATVRFPVPAPEPESLASDRNRKLRTEELHARLSFSAPNGRIWLDDQRMVLLHLTAFAQMRRELIQALGMERARDLLTRIGYSAGTQAARLAAKIRPDDSLMDAFSTGPAFHALQGLVSVETLQLDVDPEAGTYYCEQIWHDSSEDDAQLAEFGIGAEPMCWMQIGYASGYNSTFFGQPIVFREVQCQSMGHSYCRIIGKLAKDWDLPAQDTRFLQPQPFVNPQLLHLPTLPTADAPARTREQDLSHRGLVGMSSSFIAACHKLEQVASTQATVLMLGETGVGKERFAHMLHQVSKRSKGPFVAVNCGAIPENLLESELFGVERGAYTGATESRKGRFERAEGGTLFLDEIGTLNESGQVKLLRALQQKEIERMGDSRTRQVDVRVVAATNADLEQLVREGRFRADLYYRLNLFPIRIPPLRERRDDIPLLAQHFLAKYAEVHGKKCAGLSYKALAALLNYDFPGNVRELENLIERGIILAPEGAAVELVHLGLNESASAYVESTFAVDAEGHVRSANDLQFDRSGADDPIAALVDRALDASLPLDALEDGVLRAAVRRCNGNLSASARLLGLSRAQLDYRLKRQAAPKERRGANPSTLSPP